MTRKVMLDRTALIGLLTLAAACGGSDGGYGNPSDPAGPPTESATLTIATDARLGRHLVDGNGRSLYYFANDVPAGRTQAAVSSCNADCLPIWPIFDADGAVAQGIDAADVGRITRDDGRTQTTYQGFPLYYYAGDVAAGDTNGEGVDGIWFVVHDPGYSIALLNKESESARYLTDGSGRALYSFSGDTVGTPTAAPISACTGDACTTSWPVFEAGQVIVPSDLIASDFTVFTRTDGTQQSAYKGHPLYHFVGDTAPGQTNGRGIPGWQTIAPSTR